MESTSRQRNPLRSEAITVVRADRSHTVGLGESVATSWFRLGSDVGCFEVDGIARKCVVVGAWVRAILTVVVEKSALAACSTGVDALVGARGKDPAVRMGSLAM